ncbi:hypothetical protein [Lactobacillus laiwuensis]|uniref:hypothetical protein n=1 Tax=Lactobacillus laiwuensis TaxID=2841034 RepID=UPI001CC55430|nr:hypothetical protein [Lactobacillus laiwuensis]
MKLKKAIVALVASLSLIASAGSISTSQVQTVHAAKIKYESNMDTPKFMRGKWYYAGEKKPRNNYTKSVSSVIRWGQGLFEVEKNVAKWKKLGKNKYKLTNQEHNKDGSKSSFMGSTFELKKASYKNKKYKVLIDYRDDLGERESISYTPMFNHRISKKDARKLVKKCHLSKFKLKYVLQSIKDA